MSEFTFRRIRGRIIPIRRKIHAIPTQRKVGAALLTAATYAATKGRFTKGQRLLLSGITGVRYDVRQKDATKAITNIDAKDALNLMF